MLARMWTRGWRVFAPSVPITFHQWERSLRVHTLQTVCRVLGQIFAFPVHLPSTTLMMAPISFQDNLLDHGSRRQSQLKVLAVLGASSWPETPVPNQTSIDPLASTYSLETGSAITSALPAGWRVGEVWGLGQEATLGDFMSHVGVNFSTRSIEEKGFLGGLVGNPAPFLLSAGTTNPF